MIFFSLKNESRPIYIAKPRKFITYSNNKFIVYRLAIFNSGDVKYALFCKIVKIGGISLGLSTEDLPDYLNVVIR